MTSTSTLGILPTVSSSSACPTPRLQPRMNMLLDNDLAGNVLWEEIHLPATTPSVMDHLIPQSSTRWSVIEKIMYTTGVPILVGQEWQLDKHAIKQKRVLDDTSSDKEELETDNEGSSASAVPDTSDLSWSAQEFDPDKLDRDPTPKRTPEKKWARLFNVIYTSMRMSYKESFPRRSAMYPFEPADIKCPHHQWSPNFCNSPIPDVTNIQKPDVVLLDRDVELTGWAHILTCAEITGSDLGAKYDIPLYKGVITKGYLMMREQPWRRFIILFSISANNLHAHYIDRSGLIITRPISIAESPTRLVNMLNTMSLANSKYHGMDPTMHMCNQSCKKSPCDVGDKAIGWIEDAQKQKLSIISILWRSQGLFSRRTICYRVRDRDGVDYALKECWVDEEHKDHEEKVLELVWGIHNVVTLVATWDVEYEGESDSTLRICQCHGKTSPGFRCKYHRHMLLTPCGEPLSTYSTKRELLSAFRDFVVAHKEMVTKNVLHGDLSPNNLIIHEGQGYFIDFNHAQIIAQGNTSVCSHGTGTIPYVSICLLRHLHLVSNPQGVDPEMMMMEQTASNDLESLFYIFVEFVTTYDGPQAMIIHRKTEWWGDLLEDLGSRAVPYKSGLLLIKRDMELMNRMARSVLGFINGHHSSNNKHPVK
ncbi:hypothetical protein DFH29DRAFT_1007201 [Suillus ampliporus]|nr:hypothetical protein DFH29DRAFT_1007201 [Suillus ampliporus]